MQAVRKIEEDTIALQRAAQLVTELEALGPALAENGDKQTELLTAYKNVRTMATEVTSLAQHLQLDGQVAMAALSFQQLSTPLLARFAALAEFVSVKKPAPEAASGPQAPAKNTEVVDKGTKRVSMSGWLRKQGKGALSNSHRRYFILDQTAPTQLRYYETDTLQKQKGFIPLDQMESVLVVDNDKTVFGVKTTNRLWTLQADSEHDARIWVKCLSKWGERFQQQQQRSRESKTPTEDAPRTRSTSTSHVPQTLSRDASSSNDTLPQVSPRSPRGNNPNDTVVDSLSDPELVLLQQEAEKRELQRQQESSRRWKEKQELRFHREAARLKEEANNRWLASSESQDTGGAAPTLHSPTSTATPTLQHTTSGHLTQSRPTTISSTNSSNTLAMPTGSSGGGISSNSSYHTLAVDDEDLPAVTDEATPRMDPAVLQEKLRAALRLKRERAAIVADLQHQRQLFQTLVAEKQSEIRQIEDSDQGVADLREERDDAKFSADSLNASIALYKQQLADQERLVAIIQGSIKQNIDHAEQLQAELDTVEENIICLDPRFAAVSSALSSFAVDRMIAHSGLNTKEDIDEKMKTLSEAMRAHADLVKLTRSEVMTKQALLVSKRTEWKQEEEQLQYSLNTAKHTFQFLRSLLNPELTYSLPVELDELKHDFFVAIVNGIKLNLIEEGYTLKLTSPTALFTQARMENVKQADWPTWISSYIHEKCIESKPQPKSLQASEQDDSSQKQHHDVNMTPASARWRKRKGHQGRGLSVAPMGRIGGVMM